MSTWRTVRLADVLEPVKRPVKLEPGSLYATLGVRWYGNGAFVKAPVPGSTIAAKTLNQVRAGDVVYSKLFAWKGSFALIAAELDGVVASTEFPTYIARRTELLPEFFELWASRADVWTDADNASTGTTANSRNRLAPEQFLDMEMELPSLAEQFNMVSAVASVDRAIRAHARRGAAARRAHCAAREELIESTNFDRVLLREIITSVKGGKSPKCLDRPPVGDEFGVLKVSAIRDGHFRPDEAKALPRGIAPAAASVQEGDLLYSRANTSALVGAMSRADRDYPRLLLCDKTMRVTVDEDTVDPDFLVEAVGTSSPREHIETMAGGTSDSMKNISQDAFLETEVALPALDRQCRIVASLKALRRVAAAAEIRTAALRACRGALVEDLLTEPPETPEVSAAA